MINKKEKQFDKEQSLTKMLVEFHRKYSGSESRKRTFRSFINLDEKSKERGIEQLRKYAQKNIDKIEFAAIYDNISGSLIENVINHGKLI